MYTRVKNDEDTSSQLRSVSHAGFLSQIKSWLFSSVQAVL